MLLSMTGYGKKELQNNDILISIELKSINSRYLEITHKIPKLFSNEEDDVLNLIRRKLNRGKVIVNINYTLLDSKIDEVGINYEKLNGYLKIINSLKKYKEIDSKLTVDKILSLPDILDASSGVSNISYKRILSKCLNEAIDDLISMRLKEGKNLSNDIELRLNKINKNLGLIVKNSEKDQKQILRDYKKKIKSLIDKKSKIVLDDNRLLQEIVIYMEKKDINEEITRLRSHINVFADSLSKGKIEKGKRMTFLLQEFLREINTIGSKTDNVKTSHLAVEIKTEIEKIREQVQNIL